MRASVALLPGAGAFAVTGAGATGMVGTGLVKATGGGGKGIDADEDEDGPADGNSAGGKVGLPGMVAFAIGMELSAVAAGCDAGAGGGITAGDGMRVVITAGAGPPPPDMAPPNCR